MGRPLASSHFHEPIHRSAMPYSTPVPRGTERGRSHPAAGGETQGGSSAAASHKATISVVDAADATQKGKKEHFDTNIPRAFLKEPKHARTHHGSNPPTYAPALAPTVHALKQLAKEMGLSQQQFSDTIVVKEFIRRQ